MQVPSRLLFAPVWRNLQCQLCMPCQVTNRAARSYLLSSALTILCTLTTVDTSELKHAASDSIAVLTMRN